MDAVLEASGAHLDAILREFTRCCREPGLSVSVEDVQGRVGGYAHLAQPTDDRVGFVGEAFAAADGGLESLLAWTFGQKRKDDPGVRLGVMLDILASGIDFVGLADLAGLMVSRTELLAIASITGRLANLVTSSSGNVTRMRELYKSLVSDPFPYGKGIDHALRSIDAQHIDLGPIRIGGLDIISTGLDIYRDVRSGKYGDDVAEAVGANLISLMTQEWIATTPIGAWILVGSTLVQFGGKTVLLVEQGAVSLLVSDEEARQDLAGAVEAARIALDKADLDTVFDQVGETVWDLATGTLGAVGSGMAAGAHALYTDPSVDAVGKAFSAFGRAFAEEGNKARDELEDNWADTGEAFLNVPRGLADFVGAEATLLEGAADYVWSSIGAEINWSTNDWQMSIQEAHQAWVRAASPLAIG
ncbi:MAG: hypothetical protein ABFD20_04675 [Anaerolineales bacterium]